MNLVRSPSKMGATELETAIFNDEARLLVVSRDTNLATKPLTYNLVFLKDVTE